MKTIKTLLKTNVVILALGAESAGNFSVFQEGKIYFSESFGDLLEEKNFEKFKKSVLYYLKKNKTNPDIILIDLHPLYKTTELGKFLSKKYKADLVQIQHHLAHIFSAIGDKVLTPPLFPPLDKGGIEGGWPNGTFYGIALDGTGYGTDGKIWGGEIFKITPLSLPPLIKGGIEGRSIERIGHLENQVLIGGDLAVKEPARVLMAILSKFKDKTSIYRYIEKFYTRNKFEVLYNQLRQNFNCQETSSAGRVLDAVSILLGFSGNRRNYKHEPIDLLEKNSTVPYTDLKPKITPLSLPPLIKGGMKGRLSILKTTPLFEYLIKNINKDKKRLAATAQLYIAQGLYEIICHCHSGLPARPAGGDPESSKKNGSSTLDSRLPAGRHGFRGNDNIFFAGGIANNKTISTYLESKGVYINKKIPRGDAGLSFGQIIFYLLFIKQKLRGAS